MTRFPAALAVLIFLSAPPLAAQSGETEIAGSTPVPLVEEAYLAHRRGLYDQAVEGYTRIIQRRGLTRRERAISYLLRGEAQRDAGRPDEAVADFTRALRQWPGYPHAHFFRGRVHESQGRLVEAYTDVAQAARLDPLRESYQTLLAVLRVRLEESGVNVRELDAALDEVAPPPGEGF